MCNLFTMSPLPSIEEIRDNFHFLEDWEDRYRYIIDLGYQLPPYPEEFRGEAHKVRGCASQVWLHVRKENSPAGTVLHFQADSDAHIVSGLIAILLSLYSGKTARQILSDDAQALLDEMKLGEHLTAQRANGLVAMVKRIKDEAKAAQTIPLSP